MTQALTDYTVLYEYAVKGQAGLCGGQVTLPGCTSPQGARRRFVTEPVLRQIARSAGVDRHSLQRVRVVRVTAVKGGQA